VIEAFTFGILVGAVLWAYLAIRSHRRNRAGVSRWL